MDAEARRRAEEIRTKYAAELRIIEDEPELRGQSEEWAEIAAIADLLVYADEYRLQTLRANTYLDKLKVVKARLHEAERALAQYRQEWPKLHAAYKHAEQRVAALEKALEGMDLTGPAPIGPLYGIGWADAVDTMRKHFKRAALSPVPPEKSDGR